MNSIALAAGGWVESESSCNNSTAVNSKTAVASLKQSRVAADASQKWGTNADTSSLGSQY